MRQKGVRKITRIKGMTRKCHAVAQRWIGLRPSNHHYKATQKEKVPQVAMSIRVCLRGSKHSKDGPEMTGAGTDGQGPQFESPLAWNVTGGAIDHR
jgi:hypothetical protein